jgi:hypothetical protein
MNAVAALLLSAGTSEFCVVGDYLSDFKRVVWHEREGAPVLAARVRYGVSKLEEGLHTTPTATFGLG